MSGSPQAASHSDGLLSTHLTGTSMGSLPLRKVTVSHMTWPMVTARQRCKCSRTRSVCLMNCAGVGFPMGSDTGQTSASSRRCSLLSATSHCLAQRWDNSAGDFILTGSSSPGVLLELFPAEGGHGGPLALAMNQDRRAGMRSQQAQVLNGRDEQGVQAKLGQRADYPACHGLGALGE